MMKEFPKSVPLKVRCCPTCKDALNGPDHTADEVVRFVCKKDGCGYAVDLFWIGDAESRTN